MNRLEELLLLWQDQTIAAAEVAELKTLLATPEARARVAEDLFLTGVIVESLRVQQAALGGRMGEGGKGRRGEGEKGRKGEWEPGVRESVPCSPSPLLPFSHSPALPFALSPLPFLGVLTVALVLGGWYWFSRSGSEAPSAFAQVEAVQGEFFVINNQQMRPAQMGEVLVPGQGIATEGTDSGAVVQMKDAVRLKLGSDTTVFTTTDADRPGNSGPRLVLEKGDLLVEVTRSLKRKKMSVQTDLGLAVAESEEAALHVSDAAGVVVVLGEVSFRHKATGKSIRLQQGQYLAITAAGELYAAQLFSGTPQTWTTFPRVGLSTNALAYSLAFSPDSKQLAAVNRWGEAGVRLGPMHGNAPPRELKGDSCVQFSLDGKWLATADVANVRLVDLADENQVRVFSTRDRRRRILCLAFSPDGQSLAVGRAAVKNVADVEIWDVPTGSLRHTSSNHSAPVTCLAFSPDGKLLASGSTAKTVLLWDTKALAKSEKNKGAADQQPNSPLLPFSRSPLLSFAQPVWSLAFAPRGNTLAIATGPDDFRLRQPGEVALWDIDTAKVRLRLTGHKRAVTSAVFSKDGQTLITGSADTTVRFWDLKTGREYGMLKGHKAASGFEAVTVALSPDGATLATASFDQTVKLWPTTWIRTHPPTTAMLPVRLESLIYGDVP